MNHITVAADDQADLTYASARGRWLLLATVPGSAIASIDATVVGIAFPGLDGHRKFTAAGLLGQ